MSESSYHSTSISHDGHTYTLIESEKMTATELADALGYSRRTISEMKASGCPFFGRFSSVQIVRSWEFWTPGWRKKTRQDPEVR